MDVGDSSRTVPRQGEDASKILNLAHRIDRLPRTSYQNILLLIIATAWFVDTIDLSTLTFAIDPISNTFYLSEGQAGLLVSMGFAGMAIGATSSGALADRFGRKAIFQYSMITWGIASLLLAFSWSFYSLLAFRFLLGIGMGAEYPVAQSLLGEITATKTRGKAIAWVSNLIGGPFAYVAAGLLALLMLSISGWRALFVVESLLALFALVVRRGVPESPRWLESQGRIEEAEETIDYIEGKTEEAYGRPLPEPDPPSFTERVASKIGFSELLTSRYLRRAVMAWILWLCVVGGFYSVQSWIGKLLADQGFAIIESTRYILLMVLWGIPGVQDDSVLVRGRERNSRLLLWTSRDRNMAPSRRFHHAILLLRHVGLTVRLHRRNLPDQCTRDRRRKRVHLRAHRSGGWSVDRATCSGGIRRERGLLDHGRGSIHNSGGYGPNTWSRNQG